MSCPTTLTLGCDLETSIASICAFELVMATRSHRAHREIPSAHTVEGSCSCTGGVPSSGWKRKGGRLREGRLLTRLRTIPPPAYSETCNNAYVVQARLGADVKLVDMKCPNCGAQLTVDADNEQAKCEFCGATLLIDDGVQHLQVDDAEKAGYEFEKGRQRAQAEAQPQPAPVYVQQQPQYNQQQYAQPQKQQHGCLWWFGMVLLWICFLPIMATIYIARSKTLKKSYKVAIIAAIWLVCILIGTLYPHTSTNTSTTTTSTVATTQSANSASYPGHTWCCVAIAGISYTAPRQRTRRSISQ